MHRSFLRLGFAIAAAMAVATTAYASPTFERGDPGVRNVIVVSYSGIYDNAFDVSPLALFKEQPPAVTHRGGQHTYSPMTNKTRVAGAAVLATTQAGWRSGRLRKLSVS